MDRTMLNANFLMQLSRLVVSVLTYVFKSDRDLEMEITRLYL